MGLLDDVGHAMMRGRNATERSARTASLRIQLNDLVKKRTGLLTQLGASLYEEVRTSAELRVGREALFEGIEQVDAQRKRIEEEIAEIEMAANEARLSARRYVCPKCKTSVGASDLFCMGCGLPIDRVKSSSGAGIGPSGHATCANCGSSMEPDARFCTECGTERLPAHDSDDEAGDLTRQIGDEA